MKINLLSFLITINITLFSQDIGLKWTRDQLSYATILLYQSIDDTSGNIGTGTIISLDSRYFILTANHVAQRLLDNSKIIFRMKGDKPKIYNLKLFMSDSRFNWKHHATADLSMVELYPFDDFTINFFQKWSFPINKIYKGKPLPSYDTDLTFFGFPIIDLELEHFSPLVFSGQLSSGLITQKRIDTNTKSNFFYLNIPSIQGCSGSGVFLGVKKAIVVGETNTYLIGIIHGTKGDNTGGKLAAVTPAFYISDLLKEF